MTDLPTHKAESQGESRGVVEGASAGGISLEPPCAAATSRGATRAIVSPKTVVVVHDVTRPSAFRLTLGFVLVCAGILVVSTSNDVWRGLFTEGRFDRLASPAAGALLVLLGGLRLRSSLPYFMHFCVTSVLVCGTAIIGNILLDGNVSWRWLVLGGVALGYLIHAGRRVASVSILGMLGWILIGVACVGSVRGWFDFSRLGAWLGGSTESFFVEWGTECTWGTVLLLTAIGVSWSRTRPIHFLNAAMLAALAYYCFWDGYLKMVSFPGLGEAIAPLPSYDLANIDPWRWVLLGELVLLSLVLLNMALRMGALTLVCAVAWLAATTLHVDQKMGRDAVLGYLNVLNQPVQTGDDAGRTGATARRPGKLSLGPVGESDKKPAPPLTPAGKQSLLQRANIHIAGLYAWVYLTAVLSGIIAAAGLRLLINHERFRMWTAFALWAAFGAGLSYLWSIWPEASNWADRLSAFVIPTSHRCAVLLTALGSTAIFGSWSLRRSSSYRTWLYAAAVCIFIGTALTLVAIALLIRFGGLSPMPVWAYAVVAAAQSSMMWVLLMHQSTRGRGESALA